MAKLRAPTDPYCRLNGKGRLVKPDDTDPDLAALTGYARQLGVQVWRYADDKLALTSKRYAQTLGTEDAPLVFGGEGETLGTTAGKAFAALHEQSYTLQRTVRASEKIQKQVRNKRLDPVEAAEAPLDIASRDVGGEIGDVVRTFNDLPSLDDVARDLTGRKWLGGNPLIPVRAALTRLGDGAATLSRLFDRANELETRIRAITFTRLAAQVEKLTPAERQGGYQRWVETGVADDASRVPVLQSVYDELHQVDDWFYDSLKGLGVEVAPRIQPTVLVPTGRYFPHRRDLAALQDPRVANALVAETQAAARTGGVELTAEQALEVLEKQGFGAIREDRALRALQQNAARHGTELSRKDAERLLDTVIARNAERISGSLERSREYDFSGYITDVGRAYTATWTRNARRVSEVATFGRKDERVYRLLDQIRYTPDMPPQAHKFARDVYDLEVGRTRPQFSNSLFREMYSIQGAKLSMSVLYNLSQPLNTIAAFGLRPFVKAMGEAIRHPSRFASFRGGTLAEQTGALPVQMFSSDATMQLLGAMQGDIREHGMAAMLGSPRDAYKPALQAAAKGADWLVNASLAAFRYVENFNRSISQRAGEIYFDQIAEQLARRGEVGLAHRKIGGRLLELDLSPQAVLGAVRRNDDQALREMRVLAGLRVSNETQFRSDYQSMPLWANASELGKFTFQYKTFAINQTRFMMKMLGRARTDPERFVTMVAPVMLAYPAVGIALTSLRQSLMGPTLAGDQISEALNDPTFANLVIAGTVGMTMAGGLGILADLGMTAALGNSYALARSFVPPTASSLISYGDILGSVGRAAANGDPEELLRARAEALRQFGGAGSIVEQRLREREGRAEESVDPLEAVFGASPFS